jgi:hypothetical protein
MMKIRKDFNPEKTLKHIAEMRIAINHLTAVDEIRGLPGGDELLTEGYELCRKLEELVKRAQTLNE